MEAKLHRALNLKDLVLLTVVSIVGLSTVSQVSQLGYSAITLLVLCVFTFLLPNGLVVAELNTRLPEEGGFYLWTRKAFGDFHAYVAAWTYWLSNIVWLTTVIMLVTVPALYMFGDQYLDLTSDPTYNGIFGIILIWMITGLNILGMERVKWVQNIGGAALWICIFLLIAAGIVYSMAEGIPNPYSAKDILPDILDVEMLPYIALVPFCFGGLELASVMAGETIDPRRNIPRALLYGSVIVAIFYIAGVLMLQMILPVENIDIIAGPAQAFQQVSTSLHISWLGPVGALLVVMSTLGSFGAWMTGNARLPFVIGIDHYLPKAMARVHPRTGAPYVALLMQGLSITVLFLVSNAGSSVKEAFTVLLEMSVILYFIPFLYLFAAFAKLVLNGEGLEGLFPVFKRSRTSVWVVTFFGLTTTLVAVVFSCFPSGHAEDAMWYVTKVTGGAFLLTGAGLVVYYRKQWSDGKQLSNRTN